jgi:Protein of unknown function DUF2625
MKQTLLIGLFFSYTTTLFSQNKMRPIEELLNTTDSGWKLVKEWIKSAKNKVEILPVDSLNAKDALYKTQVTTRSPMGAIVYETGGILIDDGWIRILGSGSKKLNRSLPYWNKGKSFKEFGDGSSFFLVADDVIGGFFILNNGAFGKDLGKIYYFSPSSLEYEALDISYTDFLSFCFKGNLNSFYKGERWKNWRKEVSILSGESVFNFLPTLWTKEGKYIDKISRKSIPIEEQYHLNIDFREQLGINK